MNPSFEESFEQNCQNLLVANHQPILTAFSGGLDSRVLLELIKRLGLKQIACHVDHRLREESDEDCQFAAEQCLELGIPFCSVKLEPKPGSANLEAWARERRYEELERVKQLVGAEYVLTAHHQDDQVETLISRIFSGRSLTSACCIAETDFSRSLVRPLLPFAREEILTWAESEGLQWIEDNSNNDLRRTRNRIRRQVLPLLEQSFPWPIRTKLADFATRSSIDEVFLNKECLNYIPNDLCRKELIKIPTALRWRVIREFAVKQCGAEARKLAYSKWRLVEEALVQNRILKERDLGFGVQLVYSSSEQINFILPDPVADSREFMERLKVPGIFNKEGSFYSLESRLLALNSEVDLKLASKQNSSSLEVFFDWQKIKNRPLVVRNFRAGDTIRVWGRGTRKVKKLFQEKQVPISTRHRMPLVVDSELGEIVWAVGLARSMLAPIQSETIEILQLRAMIT